MCPRDVPMVTQESGLGDPWTAVEAHRLDLHRPASPGRSPRPFLCCARKRRCHGIAIAGETRREQRSKEDASPQKKKAKKMLPRARDASLCSLWRHRPLFCLLHTIITSSTLVLDRLVIHRLSSLATSRRALMRCGDTGHHSCYGMGWAMACHADDGWRRLLARRRRRRQFIFGNSAARRTRKATTTFNPPG
jgi:hypothetical protein